MADLTAVTRPPPIRLLVVDDDPLVRAGLRLLLDGDEVRVVGEAGDGRAAIAQVEALRPDVVLMDIRMPALDGLSATEAILASAQPDRTAPAVVVLTTFDADEHVLRALRAGAAGFLLKETCGGAGTPCPVAITAGQGAFRPPIRPAL